jgi:hypothetical protein
LQRKEHVMARHRLHPRSSSGGIAEVYPVTSPIRLWILRLLVPLYGQRRFVREHGFANDELADALGLGKWLEPERDFAEKEVLAELRKMYLESERMARHSAIPARLAQNVARLSALIGLSAADCRILEFFVSLHNEHLLREAVDYPGNELSTAKAFHILAAVLDIPEHEIRASLSPQAVLPRSNIITVDSGRSHFGCKFDMLSEKFADNLYSADSDPITLIRDRVAPAGPAQLALADFEHIASCLAILRPYLRNALASRRPGVNIFLHGEPGTGKANWREYWRRIWIANSSRSPARMMKATRWAE